ncbi:male-enhanced antigen 1 [Oryzias latipes]|uniref:Male-enhanced antigen 1 n=1 Tax=Oryzias latipes TaxID=8090 RepID=H2LDF5_ORYLA|nr:male-enhanced antigen 1 [Oryzias latipes]
MEVWVSAMGPERVLPSSEDDLGEEERPVDDVLQPGGAVWSGGEDGGEIDGEEEEEVASGEYHYQPLNQEPDGLNGMEQQEEEEETGGVDGSSHAQQLQQVQQRIEVMGLHLPEAPPPDSEEEEEEDDPEGAAALRSRSSIPMDADHVELVKKTMAAVALPSLGVPPWAQEISDDQWKDMVQHTLQTRQSAAALRLHRRGNVPGP